MLFQSFLNEFIVCSLLMGMGIGIDAAIVTGLRARQMHCNRIAFKWIMGVSLTHTLFPLLGYCLSHIGLNAFPLLTPLIGLIAFSLIAHFIISEIANLSDIHAQNEHDENVLFSIGLILAVSWDALWSGPAKSAQVMNWPEAAVWASFLIVGLTVALMTSIALILSRSTRAILKLPAGLHIIAVWLQYSVIGYFAWLALLRYTLALSVPWPIVLLFSLVTMAIAIYRFHPSKQSTALSRHLSSV